MCEYTLVSNLQIWQRPAWEITRNLHTELQGVKHENKRIFGLNE
jgi:hypothetical protein